MRRSIRLAALSLGLASSALGLSCPAPARAEDAVGVGEELTLEDQLKTGLKVRRPEDAEFVADVARRVQDGSLPRKLVESTYTWAVRRRQKYPFPAFEQALRLQAERLGVDL